MASKTIGGCIIGFDPKKPQLKIINSSDGASKSVSPVYLPYEDELFGTDDFGGMITSAFNSGASISSFDKDNVYVVLPDRAVAIDMLNIPNLSKFKINGALKTQSEEMYKNYAELNVSYCLVNSTKTFSTYASVVVRKEIIKNIEKALSEFKFSLKGTTFSANCEINSVLALNAKSKSHNFIFADIYEDYTCIGVCSKSKTIGFTSIPFGYSTLESQDVVDEQFLWNHDVAALAVLNATELAKAKKQLTEAAVIDPNSASSEAGEEAPADAGADTEEEQEDEGPAPYELRKQNTDDGLDDDEREEEQAAIEKEQNAAAKTNIKRFVKKARKLPKFMQRPIPETPEEMLYENFRNILKWILLCKHSIDHNANLHNPEFVILNMPKKYSDLVAKLNEDKENGISFKLLEAAAENEGLGSSLDLYGAFYMKQFNPFSNF